MYQSPVRKFLSYSTLIMMFCGAVAISGWIYNAFLFYNILGDFALLLMLVILILLLCILNYGLNAIIEEEIYKYKKKLIKYIPEEMITMAENSR